MTQSDPYQPMVVTRERYDEMLADSLAGRLYMLAHRNSVECFSCCRVSLAYMIEARANSVAAQAEWEIFPCDVDRLNFWTKVEG